MKSATLPSFWTEYKKLSEPVRKLARKSPIGSGKKIRFIHHCVSSVLIAKLDSGLFEQPAAIAP